MLAMDPNYKDTGVPEDTLLQSLTTVPETEHPQVRSFLTSVMDNGLLYDTGMMDDKRSFRITNE